jgi:uncharacterized protein
VGCALAQHFNAGGHEVVVLSRTASNAGGVQSLVWDGCTLGPWAGVVDGADVVINLAGRTVNCRYTEENLQQMMNSRVQSTKVVGEAIAAAKSPPKVWLQMSTATIYAHRFDAANGESTGILGGNEPDAPAYWARSIAIAKAWERAATETPTPHTRKVLLRTAMVMGPQRGGIFDVLTGLARSGLGGSVGGGAQYVSWIHERDFIRAITRLIEDPSLENAVNLAAPNPLPQRDFMKILRATVGRGFGLPATRWMAEIGAFALRTDTELILKSRRVVPERLLQAGFTFEFPEWSAASLDIWKQR